MKRPIKEIVRRVVHSHYLRPFGPSLLNATHYVLALTNREVIHLGQASRKEEAARIRAIVTGFSEQTVGVDEAYILRSAVLAAAVVPGALAEVGVFRGGTARVICEAKGARPLHLFDTFAGLPQPGAQDTYFQTGQYACDLDTVRAYLAGYRNVHFHPGLFPETAEPVRDVRFAFVHLDVDLYESTLAALKFFYPRMSRGGILVSHDYVEFQAVRDAFTHYFAGLSQPVIELTGNQCLVVKSTD